MILPNHSWTLKCHRKSLSCGFQCFLYTSGLRKGRRTQNEKDVFIRAFWTGDHWKIVKGTIQGSSYLRRSECSRVTVHMLDSHVDHQDHSSVRSLAVLGLDECQRKDVADNQSWVAAHSTAGSSHYFYLFLS